MALVSRIFEPFFTTKAPGSGLGLGLSISSRIMEDLGGKLLVANQPTGGARFIITLPCSTTPNVLPPYSVKENNNHA